MLLWRKREISTNLIDEGWEATRALNIDIKKMRATFGRLEGDEVAITDILQSMVTVLTGRRVVQRSARALQTVSRGPFEQR